VLGIENGNYSLATVHRQENVDDEARFHGVLKGLQMIKEKFGFPVVYPIHPRAKKQLEVFNLATGSIRVVEALDYLSFLRLERNAKLVLTDSGGVQEEACILGVPCVTLRYNTERPETLEVGANALAGTDPTEIVKKAGLMLNKEGGWKNPFGDSKAGEKIVKILRKKFA
jgi:UDP-N-acetylglucosamine 2-epimerase (non-hydrolysing)